MSCLNSLFMGACCIIIFLKDQVIFYKISVLAEEAPSGVTSLQTEIALQIKQKH